MLYEESEANPASEIICLAQEATPLDWLLMSPFCIPCSRFTSSFATICGLWRSNSSKSWTINNWRSSESGDEKIFKYYLEENSSKIFFGYDISLEMLNEVSPALSEKVNFTNDIEDICLRKYDFISCLETIEHIPDAKVINTLKLLLSILKNEGKLLISVPIESGLSSLLKQIVRLLSGQKEKETNLLTISLSLFFLQDL